MELYTFAQRVLDASGVWPDRVYHVIGRFAAFPEDSEDRGVSLPFVTTDDPNDYGFCTLPYHDGTSSRNYPLGSVTYQWEDIEIRHNNETREIFINGSLAHTHNDPYGYELRCEGEKDERNGG